MIGIKKKKKKVYSKRIVLLYIYLYEWFSSKQYK